MDDQFDPHRSPPPGGATPWDAPAPGSAPPPGGSPQSPVPPPDPPRPTRPDAPSAPRETTYRSWQPGIMPLRPLNFGDFLTLPFKAMKMNRAVVLGGPLLLTLVSIAAVVVTLILFFNDPQVNFRTSGDTVESIDGIGPATAASLTVTVILWAVTAMLGSAIVAPGVARAILGERIPLAEAWKQVWGRVGHIILFYLLLGLVSIPLLLIAYGPLLLSIGAGSESEVAAASLLGVLLAIPLGLAITVIAAIALPMIVLERIGAWGALRRTLRLVRGRFWWSVLIILVASILLNIATSILQYAISIFGFVAIAVAPENPALAIAILAVGGVTVFTAILVASYAFMGAVYTLMYIDLRIRHEGFDVDLAEAAEARAAQ